MIKRFLKRINDLIQWTKKWHFFHVFMLSTTYMYIYFFLETHHIDLLNIPLIIEQIVYYMNHIPDLLNVINNLIEFYFLELLFGGMAEIVYIPFVIGIQLLFWTINWFKHKNIQVQSKFLLKNKIYNCVYIAAFIHTTAHLTLSFVILMSACVELFTDYISQLF